MENLSLSEVRRLVEEANVPRWRGDASGGHDVSDARRTERRLDDLFRTGHTLATYGTLVPGGPNHHVVAPLGGEWTEGLSPGSAPRRVSAPHSTRSAPAEEGARNAL